MTVVDGLQNFRRAPLIFSGRWDFILLRRCLMSDARPDNTFENVEEPITAGPWSRRVPEAVRLRWTEHPPHGMAQPREEVFATIGDAEQFKRDLEANGFEVMIG
jgi:hypothetical protein